MGVFNKPHSQAGRDKKAFAANRTAGSGVESPAKHRLPINVLRLPTRKLKATEERPELDFHLDRYDYHASHPSGP
jgi:hypothetical protein